MRYSQLILSLYFYVACVNALPAPAPVDAITARASGKTGDGKKNAKAEVAGIQENIKIQNQEKKDAKGVSKAEKSGNPKAAQAAKTKLLGTIEDGKKVREGNQAKADKSNTALVDGLKKVQGAQAKEEKQAKGLKGNTAADKGTLSTLQSEFSAGIDQNKKNKNAALKGNTNGKGGKGGK
ncbi:hypothetical protein CCHL11_00089 [Colletotrichum chlorophyti]|uniref:Uncharacterized protein n=1 Tax=Colletotrichum chlorophyti TaxID=708187 RepID=A0A1Q8RUR8_9PEZI|nr:hypothetical protein CCHL11_00089 [Colletotrichum chlorophyti]